MVVHPFITAVELETGNFLKINIVFKYCVYENHGHSIHFNVTEASFSLKLQNTWLNTLHIYEKFYIIFNI